MPCGLYTFSTKITSNTTVPPTERTSVLGSARGWLPEVAGAPATAAKKQIARMLSSKTIVATMVSSREIGTQLWRNKPHLVPTAMTSPVSSEAPDDQIHPDVRAPQPLRLLAGRSDSVKRHVGGYRADPADREREMRGERELAGLGSHGHG
jgi:hypothetical protein